MYPETAQEIYNILTTLEELKFINDKQLEYLSPNYAPINTCHFYLLPKIHKKQSTWPYPDCPPGRPIVSSRICEYIDYYLQPLSNKHPSYVKDT